MKLYTMLVATIGYVLVTSAQPAPTITSWDINTDGHTGYGGILADVQQIQYSATYIYVKSTNIPTYSIGPWPGNPNIPANQNWTFKIARAPQIQGGAKTATPLGQIGVWRNGLTIYNAKDAMSYNGQNIWHQNAVVVEAASFDACKGHPAPGGVYHNHQNPVCLYSAVPMQHSGIVGYSFDGFPVYGPYAFSDTNGTGPVTRMRSSYRQRTITQRTTLPDGTVLTPSQYGPAVGGPFPLGYYLEDFEYVVGLGQLDAYNGRFAVTPEYPAGTYAYYVTIDSNGASAYPYILGPSYYGVLVAGNTGPGGGHVAITESTIVYTPANISSSPGTLNLGTVAVGNSRSDTVRLYNSGAGTLLISNVANTNAAFVPGRTSLSIPGGSSDTLSVTFTPSSGGVVQDTLRITSNATSGLLAVPISGTGATGVTRQISVLEGWNLVCVPLSVPDSRKEILFPTSVSGAFGYADGIGYLQQDTLRVGSGYWLKFTGSQVVSVIGEMRTGDTLEVADGWNIIGGLSSEVDVSSIVQVPPGIIQSLYYGYGGSYDAADTLRQGKAYWVKTGGGELLLNASPTPNEKSPFVK